ncbi:hypothetical protein [Chitinophaga varians]|uniref:hypothetical protein n=1 Tax=Chitinophaga varians TaxID=2202339 RepID=UPI00165F6E63|nr:hypothetical protein [Chitinophaga varians]MBC9912060.1 hypothetical protein [Chitinophaga varians]
MAKERKPAGQPDGNEHHTEREESGEFHQTEETSNYGVVQPNSPSHQDRQDQQNEKKQEDQEDLEDQEELEYDEDLDEHSQEEIDEENP